MCRECRRVDGRKPLIGEFTDQIFERAGIIPARRAPTPDMNSLRESGGSWETFFALATAIPIQSDRYEEKIKPQTPVVHRPDLVAQPVYDAVTNWQGSTNPLEIMVFHSDPTLNTSKEVCDSHGIPYRRGVKTLVARIKQKGPFVAFAVPSDTDADLDVVRETLHVRHVNLVSRSVVPNVSRMEVGSVSPFGLTDMTLLVDSRIVEEEGKVVTGSGIRRTKLLVPAPAVGQIRKAKIVEGLGKIRVHSR